MCPPALNSLLPGLRGHSIRVQWNYKSQGMLPVRSTRVFPCPHIGSSQLLKKSPVSLWHSVKMARRCSLLKSCAQFRSTKGKVSSPTAARKVTEEAVCIGDCKIIMGACLILGSRLGTAGGKQERCALPCVCPTGPGDGDGIRAD